MQEAIAAVKGADFKSYELTHNALSPFIENPKIAVAGLNPMPERAAPLGGEIDEIPAVHSARELGIDAVGRYLLIRYS